VLRRNPFANTRFYAEISFFILFNLAAFPVVWVTAYVLGERLLPNLLPSQLAFAIGHGCGVAVPALINFVLHKMITFRGTEQPSHAQYFQALPIPLSRPRVGNGNGSLQRICKLVALEASGRESKTEINKRPGQIAACAALSRDRVRIEYNF
jgi:hypothetical protein